MKTIEEARNEAYKNIGHNAYFGNGFNAGVEFAQRWIPVEEELPKVDKDDTWNSTHKFSKKVITKTEDLPFINYKIQSYNEECKQWQEYTPTHWRPIEYK